MQVLRPRRRLLELSGWLLLPLALLALSSPLRAESYSEEAVKAAYLLRFASYVDWPSGTLADGPFVIAVMGSPEVARQLRRLLPGHEIAGHVIQVREVRGVRDVARPPMLYVAPGFSDWLAPLETVLGTSPTLLITDDEQGLEGGAVLNFVTLDHRVRFEVSLTAAERAHLKISADLLAVAVHVRGGRRQTRDGCPPAPSFDESGCLIRDARWKPLPPPPGELALRPQSNGRREPG